MQALDDLQEILHPARKNGKPRHLDPGLDLFVRSRLEGMRALLAFYTNPRSRTYECWAASSIQAAVSLLRGTYCARILRDLCRQFISDRTVLPVNPYGDWNESMLVNEDLAQDLNLHLQELGKDITAEKVVEFLWRNDIKLNHGITKKITIRTAQRYLHALGYRWQEPKKGQYADGHERPDVVWERDKVFIPKIRTLRDRMLLFDKDGKPIDGVRPDGKRVVLWFHDETIFYAHDRRRKAWYHKDGPAKPYQKGEGHSLMIADYVSADFGFLTLPDGKRSARRVMKPGKNWDGYFTTDGIVAQSQ